MKVITIVGNRPQFIKLGVTARRLRELGAAAPFKSVVINTGQHYDEMLSDVFFSELEIEAPDYNLAIGSGPIVDQIGKMLAPLREIAEREQPDAILVYGDTNSTVAGGLVAAHHDIPLIHVEGGERLYRRAAMPEEVNRIVTDHLAELCLASSRKAVNYLFREGFGPERVKFVGDPMYDVFKLSGKILEGREAAMPADFGLEPESFGLCTLHRAENTDEKKTCLGLLEALDCAPLPVLLPAHPRLTARLDSWGWKPGGALRLIDPLGYFDFQSLLRQSALVITDSGGVGREAFFAGKPSIVPLESSAWIEAVEAGLAVMTGHNPERLRDALATILPLRDVSGLIEANFGAGDAGERIVDEVAAYLAERRKGGEGPWHALGSFEKLPRAADMSSFSYEYFRLMVASLARRGAEAPQVELDVTRSLEGATEMAALARSSGVDVRIFLDPAKAGYNVLANDSRAALADLSQDGAALAPTPDAAALLTAIGFASQVTEAAVVSDLDTPGRTNDLLEASTHGTRPLRISPWRWAEIPVTAFESEQRLTDNIVKHARRQLAQGLAG